MRALTWNLWWQFGPWRERQPGILAELKRIDADVVMGQEVWADEEGDQAEILAEALGYFVARSRSETGEPMSFGNAIFCRWPLSNASTVSLPDANGAPSPRTLVTALAETPWGPQLYANTHLDWVYTESALRQRQLETVVSTIRELVGDEVGKGLPPILGGDLNAGPDSTELRRLTGAAEPYVPDLVFTDCWAAVGDGDGYTWTRNNPNAADASFPRRRLDYLLVGWPRPKPFASPRAAWLAGTEPYEGYVPSDHYALVVELDERRRLSHD